MLAQLRNADGYENILTSKVKPKQKSASNANRN